MEIKDILTLIQAVSDSKLTSFTYEEGDTKIAFEVNKNQQVVTQTIDMKPQTVEVNESKGTQEDYQYITSPMVGTFYEACSEDSKPFIEVGDIIKKGQIIGIVEAMKLMNEIESPYDGIVEEIFIQNREMVGFEQVLVKLRVR